MTVKDLFSKYKDYTIMLFGKPLSEQSIPFSNLPKDKDMYKCDVIDYKVINDVHGDYSFSFNNKKGKYSRCKGYVYAYIK